MNRQTYIDGDKTILDTDFYLYLLKKEDESKKSNNIIDELEKWLEYNLGAVRTNQNYDISIESNIKEDIYYRVLDKLKQLKENGNEMSKMQ